MMEVTYIGCRPPRSVRKLVLAHLGTRDVTTARRHGSRLADFAIPRRMDANRSQSAHAPQALQDGMSTCHIKQVRATQASHGRVLSANLQHNLRVLAIRSCLRFAKDRPPHRFNFLDTARRVRKDSPRNMFRLGPLEAGNLRGLGFSPPPLELPDALQTSPARRKGICSSFADSAAQLAGTYLIPRGGIKTLLNIVRVLPNLILGRVVQSCLVSGTC